MRENIPIGLIVTLEDENDALTNPKPVEAAGGVPVLFPYSDSEEAIQSLLDLVGGLILTGGRDVDPRFYHESPHPKLQETEPLRDPIELQLIREALKRDMPILGICRGIQTLNVAAGGTLFQDIASFVSTEINHANAWESALNPDNPQEHHPIRIDTPSRLFELIGVESVMVNSYHHQAISNVAPGFQVTARAPDGIIEAMESRLHTCVLGLQCHIELLWQKNARWFEVYKAFVNASSRYHRSH